MSEITWDQVTAAADLKEAAIQRLRAAKAEVKAAEAAFMAANLADAEIRTRWQIQQDRVSDNLPNAQE